MLKTVHLMRVSAMFVKLWTMLYKCITTQTYAYAYGFTSAGRLWMRLSLRYNGLFRSFSNYRVDNKGFDSRGPARSRPLGLCECFRFGSKMEERTKLWRRTKRGSYGRGMEKVGEGRKKTKRSTRFNWAVERNIISKSVFPERNKREWHLFNF